MDQGFSSKPSQLEQALRAKRGLQSQAEAATEIGVAQGTYSRLERGIHAPSGSMAMTVGAWLGWSEDEVVAAARSPALQPAGAPNDQAAR